ncbi:MAG TPA: CoA pyrophosphatase [Gemmatimonadaceae bacterium]|nr:CoA pyrophosphatase [Gemmatimonadaceae bacterium]
MRERPGVRLEPATPLRRAAVALILRVDRDSGPELLLIKRAAYEGDPWSAQVAFPGGREEAVDLSLEATAIRETWEETGIDLARDGRLIGTLDDVRPSTIVHPALVISPFVAVLEHAVPLTLSDEVADAFWVPVAELLEPGASRQAVVQLATGPRTVRSFQHGAYVIWGLTERILHQFLDYLPS